MMLPASQLHRAIVAVSALAFVVSLIASGCGGNGDEPVAADEIDSGTEGPGGTEEWDSRPCAIGKKRCDGLCVATTDTAFGCGGGTCSPCRLYRANAVCGDAGCTIESCRPGYGDCDQLADNGCETDLSLAEHCGACGTKCGSATPNCGPSQNGLACLVGCPGDMFSNCNHSCVDTTSSAMHCGSCENACPSVTNGQPSCKKSRCVFTCSDGFHECSKACASNTSVETCGTSCTPCPAAPNAVASCVAGACSFVCAPGFGDCDSNAANGCEATLDGRACGEAPPPEAGPPPEQDASASQEKKDAGAAQEQQQDAGAAPEQEARAAQEEDAGAAQEETTSSEQVDSGAEPSPEQSSEEAEPEPTQEGTDPRRAAAGAAQEPAGSP